MPAYLLYGEDNFSSRRKLAEIKSRFYDANMGDINITVLDGETVTFEQIKRAIYLVPFLAPKRLIIIKNILTKGKKETQEQVSGIFNDIPQFSIVFFYEDSDVEKTALLYKKIKSAKKAENFPKLSGAVLYRFIEKEVRACQAKIEKDASYRLAEITGPDLWRLSLEIDKLASYAQGRAITKDDVENLVKEEIHPKVFGLIDALAARNIPRATFLLSELISSGENENYILTMIAYQFRNLLIVKDLVEKQKPLSEAKLHPYVLSKARAHIHNFSNEKLKDIYGKLLEADINIKTGFLKPQLALDLLIAEFSN